jgi:uncharacterized protein YbjT (DUF2867 family)
MVETQGTSMARFLVTGGAGFMGSHLVDSLLKQRHLVRVLDDSSNGKRENLPQEIHLLQGDVTDPRAVEEAFEDIDRAFTWPQLPLSSSPTGSGCERTKSTSPAHSIF